MRALKHSKRLSIKLFTETRVSATFTRSVVLATVKKLLESINNESLNNIRFLFCVVIFFNQQTHARVFSKISSDEKYKKRHVCEFEYISFLHVFETTLFRHGLLV